MKGPRIHIVGGFLGSGKTTAIISAARQLIAQGQRVGVVTNDQGKFLVDTQFIRSENIPAVEVTGGCLCCNYDDFEEKMAELNDSARPDVIFAESVGSCADIVATVIRPLSKMSRVGLVPSSFTVLADSRLLKARLNGVSMPFSEDVVYLFDKQLEEAGLILVNKSELLEPAELESLVSMARDRFKGVEIRCQNSLDNASVDWWVTQLASDSCAIPTSDLEIDYRRYGAAESEMAWLDQKLRLYTPEGRYADFLPELLNGIESDIVARKWPVGHLKFMLSDGHQQQKVSFTTASTHASLDLSRFKGKEIQLLINARIVAPAELLAEQIGKTVAEHAKKSGFEIRQSVVDGFHPADPKPVHRFPPAHADNSN
jgi:Ni2+-binding GTPase involved in maturation of urease and hydrogenase